MAKYSEILKKCFFVLNYVDLQTSLNLLNYKTKGEILQPLVLKLQKSLQISFISFFFFKT